MPQKYRIFLHATMQSTIDEAINLYDALGKDAAFERINEMLAPGLEYPYVMDRETLEIVAHGQNPAFVGAALADKITSRPAVIDDIRSNLVNDGDTIVRNYGVLDLRAGGTTSKTALFQLHDG